MSGDCHKVHSTVQWILPLVGHFKFSVGRAARVKLGPASIGRSLSYGKENYLAVFYGPVGIKESNKAKILAIRAALTLFLTGQCFLLPDFMDVLWFFLS